MRATAQIRPSLSDPPSLSGSAEALWCRPTQRRPSRRYRGSRHRIRRRRSRRARATGCRRILMDSVLRTAGRSSASRRRCRKYLPSPTPANGFHRQPAGIRANGCASGGRPPPPQRGSIDNRAAELFLPPGCSVDRSVPTRLLGSSPARERTFEWHARRWW